MNLLVLTGLAPRHRALVRTLRMVGAVTYVAEEPRDRLRGGGPAMQEHFARVADAERLVFGNVQESPDILLPQGLMSTAAGIETGADRVIVFGTSWIRPPLFDAICAKRAINLHAGIAPEYRGSACNFWAEYDGHPELVGMTIHLLTPGLDDGPIYARVLAPAPGDPYVRGMLAVMLGQMTLADLLTRGLPDPTPQDVARHIRYSHYRDFTEDVCAEYLARIGAPREVAP